MRTTLWCMITLTLFLSACSDREATQVGPAVVTTEIQAPNNTTTLTASEAQPSAAGQPSGAIEPNFAILTVSQSLFNFS
jgi:hypothetical protein